MSVQLFKVVVRLGLVYLLEAVLAGIFLPVGENPLLSMGIWFCGLVGGTWLFVRFALARRRRLVGHVDTTEFLEDIFLLVLGLVAGGPIAVASWPMALAKFSQPAEPHDRWLVLVPAIAAVVFVASVVNTIRFLTRPLTRL